MRNFDIKKAIKSPQFYLAMLIMLICAMLFVLLNSCETSEVKYVGMDETELDSIISVKIAPIEAKYDSIQKVNDSINAKQDTLLAILHDRDEAVMLYAKNCLAHANMRIDTLKIQSIEINELPENVDTVDAVVMSNGFFYSIPKLFVKD